jgi:serine acetyltransferase
MRVLREIAADTASIARSFTEGGPAAARTVIATLLHDGSQALILSRLAQAARRHGVPAVGGVVRRLQTAFFGMEIARDVQLGEGVVFLHTVGIVIGGNAQIGDRVLFLGGNTIGSINRGAYPRIGNDVVIGAGARILGPVNIGDGAAIGANAVVVCDVPAGAVAVGVPAVVRAKSARTPTKEAESPASQQPEAPVSQHPESLPGGRASSTS